jgi:hypothetical protein
MLQWPDFGSTISLPLDPYRLECRRGPDMTIPASTIKDEVHQLIAVQIEALGQPSPLTSSQLREYHERFEKIRMLGQELDRMGMRSFREHHLEIAS